MAIPELLDTSLRLTDSIYYGLSVQTGNLVPTSRTISTTSPLTGGGDLSANRTLAITLTGGGSGAVGTGTTIATTAPLTGGGDLSANRTLALTTNPVGQTPVGETRTITGHNAISINTLYETPVALSSDIEIDVAEFNGINGGVVLPNAGGIGGKFLRDDATWQNSAVAGVSDITAIPGLTASAGSGSVTLDQNLANITTKGGVPATGGADGTKYLSATNPLSWSVPGLGGYVRLQASTPGSLDTGNIHISGAILADGGNATIGDATSPGLGMVESLGTGALFGYFAQTSGVLFGPSVYQRRSRGTVASPTATQANDELGGIFAVGYSTSGAFSGSVSSGLIIKADGNASSTRQAAYEDLIAGDVSAYTTARVGQTGILVQPNLSSASTRAGSTLDVQGSFGAKVTTVSSSGTTSVGSSDYSFISTSTRTFTLPTAVGCAGRHYIIENIVTGTAALTIGTTSGQTISGVASGAILLRGFGDFIDVVSDGANWWIVDSHMDGPRDCRLTSSAALANTVTETAIGDGRVSNILWDGSIVGIRAAGKFSNTGTPTLRFRIKQTTGGSATLGDSTAITTASGASSWSWQIEGRIMYRTVSGSPVLYWLGCRLYLQSNSSGAMTTYNMALATPPTTASGDTVWGITAEWGAADPANTLTCLTHEMFLELPSRVS